MKFAKALIIGIVLSIGLASSAYLRSSKSASASHTETETETQTDSQIFEGSTSNDPKVRQVDAVSYSIEPEKSNPLSPFKDHVTTRSPIMTEKIIKQVMESITGEPEIVGESNNSADYYDGVNNLKASQGECSIYSTRPQDCLSNSRCGWCDENKSCIKGSRAGPYGNACPKEKFIYFSPGRDWDPLGTGANRGLMEESGLDNNVTFH